MRTIDRKDVDGLLNVGSVSRIPQVALIRAKLLEAENEVANVKDRYLPRHPKRIAAQNKVADLKRELASILSKAGDILERDYESARQAERKLDQSLQEQEQKALERNKIAIPYNVLQREIESDRALFQSITLRLKETNVTRSVDSPSFRVIEEPLVAASPAKPRKVFILGLALALGLTLGVGTVIGRDGWDSSLRTLDEAEAYLERPVLAAIPDGREALITTTTKTVKEARSWDAPPLQMLFRSQSSTTISLSKPKRFAPFALHSLFFQRVRKFAVSSSRARFPRKVRRLRLSILRAHWPGTPIEGR